MIMVGIIVSSNLNITHLIGQYNAAVISKNWDTDDVHI